MAKSSAQKTRACCTQRGEEPRSEPSIRPGFQHARPQDSDPA